MARLLHFAAAVALGGLATAGLTACTGDAEASPSPTPLVTVSTEAPSPTPTLTAEEELLAQIPEDARAEGFVEATNFSRFFLELYPAMYGPEHRTELFDFLCADDSEFCSNALAGARENASDGAWSEGGAFTWPGNDVAGGLQDDDVWNVSQDFAVTDTTTFLADGSEFDVVRGGTGRVGVELDYVDGHWRVLGVNFQYDDE